MMRYRFLVRLSAIMAMMLSALLQTGLTEGQMDPLPLDITVVDIIERVPASHPRQLPSNNNCAYQPSVRLSEWILMSDDAGEAVLCHAATGEMRSLPLRANWLRYSSDAFRQPTLSPDGQWLMIGAYGAEQYDYYAVSMIHDDVVPVGSIPYNLLSTYPPVVTWLGPTRGALIHLTDSNSLWDTLYEFDVTIPNSVNAVMRGYPDAINDPPRVESLYSGQWLSGMAGTSMGTMPCEFAILDEAGFRVYPLEYNCQVESFSSDPYVVCGVIRSFGGRLTVLRVLDAATGQSELISLDVTSPDNEPTIIYRGEIDYMLENHDGTTLSALGTDGQIPNTMAQTCMLANITPFSNNDLLLATSIGAHIIPRAELPELQSVFPGILATSPDRARVLLSNGAIYDVVESRLVGNITGGASIAFTDVIWHSDGRIVLIENYNPETDEQITIRLRG